MLLLDLLDGLDVSLFPVTGRGGGSAVRHPFIATAGFRDKSNEPLRICCGLTGAGGAPLSDSPRAAPDALTRAGTGDAGSSCGVTTDIVPVVFVGVVTHARSAVDRGVVLAAAACCMPLPAGSKSAGDEPQTGGATGSRTGGFDGGTGAAGGAPTSDARAMRPDGAAGGAAPAGGGAGAGRPKSPAPF